MDRGGGGLLSTGSESQTPLSTHARLSTVTPGPKGSFLSQGSPGNLTGSEHFITFYFNEMFIFQKNDNPVSTCIFKAKVNESSGQSPFYTAALETPLAYFTMVKHRGDTL